jgi:hypothetical protein
LFQRGHVEVKSHRQSEQSKVALGEIGAHDAIDTQSGRAASSFSLWVSVEGTRGNDPCEPERTTR